MKRLLFAGVAAVACVVAGMAAAGTTTKPAELPRNYLLSALPPPAARQVGELARLRAGVTYTASQVPLALRLTPPDGGWTGAQWKSARLGERGGGPPFYGWAAIGKGGNSAAVPAPRGLIVITTAYARTPSVAQTVARLRSRGRYATYEPASPVKLAGFSGVQFDGRVDPGRLHVFAPFSDANHFQDAFYVDGSELFRVIVLNVRAKTVVVFVDSFALSADEFPAFLAEADRMLSSLR